MIGFVGTIAVWLKRCGVFVALVGLAICGGFVAQAHGRGAVIMFFPGGRSRAETWTVVKGLPYAMWDAKSAAAPGTELPAGVIDSAPLVPHALFETDQDIVNRVRVWLPKGGLLVKMGGAPGDWYCTWRFDFKSQVTQQDVDHGRVDGLEYNLCVEARADGQMTKARVLIAHFRDLMTISQDDSGATRYRDDIQDYNLVKLTQVDNSLLPHLANFQVYSWWNKKASSVCLNGILAAIRPGGQSVSTNGPCFSGVGQSVQFAGGTYTLILLDNTQFKIRIDNPLNVQGLVPPGGTRPE